MHRLAITLCLALAASGFAAAAGSPLESAAWLAGCWASETAEAGSGEHWLPPAGGTMLGVARTVKEGRTVEYEFVQIRENAEGRLVYIALPSGQEEATFTATSVTADAMTFENPEHDFPRRVIYRAMPDGRLVARIEGMQNGSLRSVDFPMRRAPCDALAGR